jgi:hypothetical protein
MILQGTKKAMSLNGGRNYSFTLPTEWVKHHNIIDNRSMLYFADEAIIIIPNKAKINIDKIKESIKLDEKAQPILIGEELTETETKEE